MDYCNPECFSEGWRNAIKKKVMLVCTNADRAGAPNHLRDLALGLQRESIDLCVVVGETGPISEDLISHGLTVHVIPEMRSRISLFRDIVTIIKLLKHARNENPDLIHCHSSKAGMVGRLVGWLSGKPSIFTIHGWGFGAGRKKSTGIIVFSIEQLLKPLTTHYIAVSDYDRQVGIKSLHIPARKIKKIHNGVPDSGVVGRGQAEADIIMVARNDYQKDYETLARALADIEISSARFVGDRTDTIEFIRHCRQLSGSNANKLHFLGPRDDVPELLSTSRILVLSSRFEGLPISIIEAMRQGLPIVASNVGGVPELVIDGENGFLFRPGDHAELAHHIQYLLSNPEVAEQFGGKSRQRFIAEFSSERMIQETLDVYNKVLDHRTR